MKPPFIKARGPDATEAFEVHAALARTEAREPALLSNPQWLLLRMEVFDEFCKAFDVGEWAR